MAQQLEKIFLGNTPSEQRKFLVSALVHLKDKYPKIVIPCCGQFTLAKCALEAGYKAENIITSEISLFSCVLGYIYGKLPLLTLDFSVLPPYREEYETLETDLDRGAFLLWLMKIQQLHPEIMYERVVYDDIVENKDKHVANFKKQLEKNASLYDGITFRVRDLRDELKEDWDEQTIVIVNPPAFKGGYEKMFKFDEVLEFNLPIEQFDLGKEYVGMYEASKLKKHPTFWYKYKTVEGFNPHEVVYGREYFVDRYDYWLLTKPEILSDFKFKGAITFKNEHELKKYKNVPMWGIYDELKPDTKVDFRSVPAEVALYYRDLWAHKLGNTKAEHYFLILLDKKVFATVGFHTSELFRLKSTRVFENYGFNATSHRHPRINRLMMLLITCKDMAETLRRAVSNVNRVYELKGLRTTCLSKYRKVKLNNGILKVEKSEKMPDGVYKIMYDTDFHDRTFSDCVTIYLEEEKQRELSTNKEEE